ncbi:glutathione S-transferase [Trichosporon asahii var. asahii CBS 8904]|uniref:glutathione transferase n=2 Tax=Trichosporon asahii var. asahii TaxID=189963 RepID=K1WBI6_TRIAC|nr:glutathione S-transferase [Trichosporon asahii var. asahii CBS 2479]EJT48500.1 glutathione S-transferase [Trichosporon asahii var. asahii CBS 2479]EKC99053.1 glutathione S-transferase [Trichosporon asahii var. asahii CBS 8904]
MSAVPAESDYEGPPYILYGHPYWLRVLAIMQLGGVTQDQVAFVPTITGNLWEDLKPGEPSDMEPFNDKRPQLVDTERLLSMFKGRAICRSFMRFEQACAVEVSDFDPVASELIDEVVAKDAGFDYDDARYKELKGEFEDVLESYERMLSKTKYLAGDKMTAADVYHLPCIRALNKHSDAIPTLKNHKNVKRWWDELAGLDVQFF